MRHSAGVLLSSGYLPSLKLRSFLQLLSSLKSSLFPQFLRSLRLIDHRGDMPELAFIVAGSRSSVKVEFAPDPESPNEKPPIQVFPSLS